MIDALDKVEAKDSLIDFIKILWPVLEPGREFKSGWALDCMADHLQAISNGQIKRLLINIPPGCMKSLMTGVFWPAWVWGPLGQPHKRFVHWSYSEALTIRDNRKLRNLVTSDIYRRLWGDVFQVNAQQNEKKLFETDKTGFSFASGVGGGGTGHRGDYLRVDDPHKVGEAESDTVREAANQWIAETLTTRVADDESAVMIVMQRIHERDVSGFILAKELGFEHLCLPMEYEHDHPTQSKTSLHFKDPRTKDGELLWPERFSAEQVEADKKSLQSWGGSYAVAGQFQQRPVARGGGMFKRMFAKFTDHPIPGKSVRGWDLAASESVRAAWTVGVKMTIGENGNVYIEDVVRFRGSPAEVKAAILMAAQKDGFGTLISLPQDPGQAGLAQKSEIGKTLSGYNFRFSPETGSKEIRAVPLAAQWEAGNIYLVRAYWNDDLLNEMESFPAGEFKDQVDAMSRAYAELLRIGGHEQTISAPSMIRPK